LRASLLKREGNAATKAADDASAGEKEESEKVRA